MDNSRTIISTDNSTVELNSSEEIRVKDGGITRPKLVSVGQQISSSSGSYTTTSGSFVDVTNLSVTITTTGRPVMLMLISDASGGTSAIGADQGSAVATVVFYNTTFNILRGSTEISRVFVVGTYVATGSTHSDLLAKVPPGSLNHLDTPSAGTYTYKVQARASSSTAAVTNCKLVAFEL